MSELLHKTIKRVDLRPTPWHQTNGWYGHVVYFTDGTKGEIYQCAEANPEWLRGGKSLSFINRPNKFPDKPFIQTVESIDAEIQHEREEQKSPAQNTSYNRFQKHSNGGGGWKGYGRYEDSPEIWLRKQKFISILKLYEVLMPLVVKGDIKYDAIQNEITKHLKYTIQESGMNEPVAQATISSTTHIPKQSAKQIQAHKQETKTNDRTIHTSHEAVPEQELNPDKYSNQESPTLFAEDTDMGNEPISSDLMEKITGCKTKAKLLALQKSLTEKQLKNKNIMEAFFAQKNKITKKK